MHLGRFSNKAEDYYGKANEYGPLSSAFGHLLALVCFSLNQIRVKRGGGQVGLVCQFDLAGDSFPPHFDIARQSSGVRRGSSLALLQALNQTAKTVMGLINAVVTRAAKGGIDFFRLTIGPIRAKAETNESEVVAAIDGRANTTIPRGVLRILREMTHACPSPLLNAAGGAVL